MKQVFYIAIICSGFCAMCTQADNGPADVHAQHEPSPVMKDEHASHQSAPAAQTDHSGMIVLNTRQQFLAGIQVDTVRAGAFDVVVNALGIVAADESSRSVVTAKVPGRIERLHARNPGSAIGQGAPLYDLYSEVLIAEQQDLLLLLAANASSGLIAAARSKLRLHGLTQQQLNEMERSRIPFKLITVYSPVAGYIADLPVREGQYVDEGDLLFGFGSLDVVRINVQIYPHEITSFAAARTFVIGDDTLTQDNKLFDNPALDPSGKIFNFYMRVANKNGTLRPGMMVKVRAFTPVEDVLAVPVTSLLVEQQMHFTWIQEPDGMFNRRMVTIGRSNGTQVEIVSGLKAGDRVVTAGIYLLNSEFILRKGANSMHSMHNHGG
jgi:membrane fusion protein, copper/silver efflux system